MSDQLRGEITGLGYYIRNDIYHNFKLDRKDLEVKWQRNLDAFNSVSTGHWKKGEAKGWRSDTFIQATKIKVLSAYSIVTDMMLAGSKIPFSLKPAPADAMAFEDMPDEQKEETKDQIEDAQAIIDQQFEDCKADRELMKCIMSGAMYGESISKKYIHMVKRSGFNQVSMAPQGLQDDGRYTRFQEDVQEVKSPAVENKSLWNFFRDLETDDLQAGIGCVERDFASPYELRKLIGKPFWIKANIERAIEQADPPGGKMHQKTDAALPPGLRDIKHRHKTMERLEFWGRVPRNIVEDFEEGLETGEEASGMLFTIDSEHTGDEVEIMCVMADDEVVRYSRMEDGERPYDRAVWEIKLDHTSGTGVADNLEAGQQVLNGMVRAFEDNKKLSANVITAVKKRYLAPGWDGDIQPGTQLEIAEECDDARRAIQQIIIQDVGESLLDGIHLIERYNDEASQLPKIMQGETADKKSPDTAYELNQLLQNAGKYLGGVIRNYDEGHIEPWGGHFFRYNMADPNQTKGKGNFIAKAMGFSSFQDRVERLGKLMQVINLILSHEAVESECKLREVLTEVFKALDTDPNTVLKTADEKNEESQRMLQARDEEDQWNLQISEGVKNSDHAREKDLEELKGQVKLMSEQQNAQIKQISDEQKAMVEQMSQEQKFTYDLLLEIAKKQGVEPK